MKARHLLVAFICSLLFADSHGYSFSRYGYSFRRFLRFSRNSICRRNDICRTQPQVMRHVMRGLVVALRECQNQFKDRRWNCTEKNDSIEKIMRYDFRESAFLSAIRAAGVTFVVSRACSLGDLSMCQCDTFKYREGMTPASREIHNRQISERFHERGACDRNIDYGEEISRTVFTDKNAVADARTELTRWNYEAGRKALRKLMKKNCKCFGYSGTCAQEACWLVLPTFSRLGSVLRERFNSASKVSFGNKGKTFHHDEAMKRPTAEDLVYTTDAPSFCEPNPAVGSLGTKGRYCNATSKDTDGCGLMCCGRDHKTSIERSEKYCDCVFHWCCSVKCRTCHIQRTVSRCR